MYEPKYIISPKLLNVIGKIEAAKEVIENAPLVPQWERQFMNDAEARTVHFSTHIEGNALEFSEVKKVLTGRGEEVVARERDLQEILNYREVVKYIEKMSTPTQPIVPIIPMVPTNPTITESTIRELHRLITNRILSPEKQGKYRTQIASIRNSITGEVSFVAPEAPQINILMTDLTTWLTTEAKDVHPVLKAGMVHYELVRIHPFEDGNGRTARALATLSLYLDGYNIRRFFSLDEHYDQDAAAYYSALQAANKGELTTWLEYFSEGLAIELNRVKERVLKLSHDSKLRKTVGQIALSERQERVIEQLQDVGYVQNKDFKNIFPGISEDTVLRELKDLVIKGLIFKKGSTKGARYVLR
ncbi:MAG: Fic family protein [candidate division WWE3 bacterium]|nr:Fic family protein [candidate division WWE3 bacterium]